MLSSISSFIKAGSVLEDHITYLAYPLKIHSTAIEANAYYFNQQEWAEEYLVHCHRSEAFKNRWMAATGDWTDKIVVDIGCGPGNIYATLQKKSKLLIGIDVAPKSLEMASALGYIPILADAANLPFISGFADLVVLNATLHHCEDMVSVLREAARLVKPGGALITDHDPQLSAWDYKGLAKLLWNLRLVYYNLNKHGFHKTKSQQHWALASEIHHKPGDGVTEKFFRNTLEPLNFKVNIFPHNHQLGSDVLQGSKGKAEFKYWLGNVLSGRLPNADGSALSLMCVANKSYL
jgi:ubiquinone/menaquinone biosynthesis C-methylase UbiE